MASCIQSSLLSAREKALLGQYDDALTFFDGVVADVQVLLRSCEPKDKAQWLTFKEKVQEEATLVKDLSSLINCFKDQPGRVSERGVVSSKRPDVEAPQFFADKDVNSFPSRPQVQKQTNPILASAAPRVVRTAEQNPEQRYRTPLHMLLTCPSHHCCRCLVHCINVFCSDKSSSLAGPTNALLMRALQLSTGHAPHQLVEAGTRK